MRERLESAGHPESRATQEELPWAKKEALTLAHEHMSSMGPV